MMTKLTCELIIGAFLTMLATSRARSSCPAAFRVGRLRYQCNEVRSCSPLRDGPAKDLCRTVCDITNRVQISQNGTYLSRHTEYAHRTNVSLATNLNRQLIHQEFIVVGTTVEKLMQLTCCRNRPVEEQRLTDLMTLLSEMAEKIWRSARDLGLDTPNSPRASVDSATCNDCQRQTQVSTIVSSFMLTMCDFVSEFLPRLQEFLNQG